MKKEKVTYPVIRKIKPLFWKECRFCEDKFKWENGYEILEYTKNAHFWYSYCCNECADSAEQLKSFVIHKIPYTMIKHRNDEKNNN